MYSITMRPGAVTRKPGSHTDAGVLEVKLRQTLQNRESSVAIGILSKNPPRIVEKIPYQKGVSKKHQKTQIVRRGSFREDREIIMKNLHFMKPTVHEVDRQVHLKKIHKQQEIASLPPIAGVFKPRPGMSSKFPTAYNRGELPILIEHSTGGNAIKWTVDLKDLNFSFYLPLFLEGIREKEEPYHFLATKGIEKLIKYGKLHPQKIHQSLHNMIEPLRMALNTRNVHLVASTIKLLKKFLEIEGIGVALLPYYRQLLPVLNLFLSKRKNLGDEMDYGQRKQMDLNALIQDVLEELERTGGPDAFINLKYMVPTYQSCLK